LHLEAALAAVVADDLDGERVEELPGTPVGKRLVLRGQER
jgi:hypothetical protein